MMDFIYDLYQNDNFVLYLTIALVVLIILFVVVFFFGKKDQKLEETKRLQKIELDAFKEEKEEPKKVEISETKEENTPEVAIKEEAKEEEKPVKSIFDETQTLPLIKDSEKEEIKPELPKEPTDVEVTTFEPVLPKKTEEEKPIFSIADDEPLLGNTNDDLSKDLSEFEKLKQEFKNIDLPKEEKKEERKPLFADEEVIPSRLDRKLEEKPEIPSRLKDRNEEKKYTPGPQVFSSVFVNNKEDKPQEKVVEEKVEEKPKNISLFTIADDDNLELPSLKKEEKKEGPNIDNITGETYNINR